MMPPDAPTCRLTPGRLLSREPCHPRQPCSGRGTNSTGMGKGQPNRNRGPTTARRPAVFFSSTPPARTFVSAMRFTPTSANRRYFFASSVSFCCQPSRYAVITLYAPAIFTLLIFAAITLSSAIFAACCCCTVFTCRREAVPPGLMPRFVILLSHAFQRHAGHTRKEFLRFFIALMHASA